MSYVDQIYAAKAQKEYDSEQVESYLSQFQLQTLLNNLNRSRNDLMELLISFEDIDNFLYKEGNLSGDIEPEKSDSGEKGILEELKNASNGISSLISEIASVRNNIAYKVGHKR